MSKAKTTADLIAEFAVEELGGRPDPIEQLQNSLFSRQSAFIEDHSNPMRAACCGRRAGKSQGITRGMLLKCLRKPRSVAVYFATTMARARKLVWDCPDGLPNIVGELGLRDELAGPPNESEHRMDFRNGSVLWIAGCETLADARNWKGLRYDLAVLDECQDWPEEILRYMVDEALKWALMDRWRSAELLLTGTPAHVLTGLFYEICAKLRKGWAAHHWTAQDNPHVDAAGFLTELMNERGLQIDDPIVQREFFGIWVQDVAAQLYQYCAGRNDYTDLPGGEEWHHALGMDVGIRDWATFVLGSWRRYDRTVYVQDAYGEQAKPTDAPVTRFSEIIRGFQQKFGTGTALQMDCGALGLGYQLELRNRFQLNVEAAKKTEKASAIRLMNDQMRLGRIRVSPRCKPLLDEWQRLQMDPKTQIEKPGQACDFSDAALYCWRYAYAYLATPEPDQSPSAEQRRMVERVLAQRIEALNPSLERERREMGFVPRYEGA